MCLSLPSPAAIPSVKPPSSQMYQIGDWRTCRPSGTSRAWRGAARQAVRPSWSGARPRFMPEAYRGWVRRRLRGRPAGRRGRYHRRMPAQTWVEPGRPGGVDASGWSRSRRATSTTCAASRSSAELWRWTIMGPQDEAGLLTLVRDAPWPTPRPARSDRSRRSTGPRVGRSAAAGTCRSCPSTSASRSAGRGSPTPFQRTGANREAKLLQLTHAFETLDANRVEFKTHSAQRAVSRWPSPASARRSKGSSVST